MAMATSFSTCTASTQRGQHFFQISEYSLSKAIGIGKYIRSNTFNVGGYDWCIRYYPDGVNRRNDKYISIFIELMTENIEVRALFWFKFISQPNDSQMILTGVSKLVKTQASKTSVKGLERFYERNVLEGSSFLNIDSLTIECWIVIVNDPQVLQIEQMTGIMVPPSELSNDFAKLLESKEVADVTFYVKGEKFPTHRAVLVARSPVFKGQLCVPMMEKDLSNIIVHDMEPEAFKGMLHFIYTDKFPELDRIDEESRKEIVRHLLVAADRYAIERLKLICESMLCNSIDIETVATRFAIADKHHCKNMKIACLNLMTSPNRMDQVIASQEYENLKRKNPNLAVEVLESICKFPKI